MSSIQPPKPPTVSSAASATATDTNPAGTASKASMLAQTQSNKDRFDPTAGAANFQASINDSLLPDNAGEANAKNTGKGAKPAKDANDPSATSPSGKI